MKGTDRGKDTAKETSDSSEEQDFHENVSTNKLNIMKYSIFRTVSHTLSVNMELFAGIPKIYHIYS